MHKYSFLMLLIFFLIKDKFIKKKAVAVVSNYGMTYLFDTMSHEEWNMLN